ncbi:ribonuclease H-like domain, reverse transcriptase, RNA-dependent DNA polymerase [Tanacetum coccineum]
MKEQAYNKEQGERPRPHELNDKSNLIDLMKEYVIGTIVSISDAIPFNYVGVDKIRRTVILEDYVGARLECCFFYSWSDKFSKLYDERDKSGIAVMILQLCKKPSVTPAMYSTKLYINNDIPEIAAFRKRDQAHINVEFCNQFGSIKYPFKYINKGPDRVTAAVEDEEKDEIKDYYDCRYLSSCEAVWRIFRFDIHHRYPAVERLPFHLPNQQFVVFDPSESIDFQLDKVSANTSKFLALMDRNKTDVQARKSIRRAQKWEDFREFEGVVYPTCKEACYSRGLLEDDKEYIEGIIEASEWGMGDYLRNYFVMLILSDSMSRPEIVWEKTWKLLAEDVLQLERQKRNNPDLELSDTQRYNICLMYIEEKLLSNSKSLKNIVNMPYPNFDFTMEGYNRLIYDEMDYKIPELIIQHQQLYASLTEEQTSIYNTIIDACNNNKGGMFFVYGYGGTGIYTTNSDKVFGGKVVVFGGNFRQILPVIPNGSRQDIVHALLNMSYLWQHCTVLKLTKNMRLRVGCNPEDAEEINDFADWILNIGEGKIGGKNDGHAPVEFPRLVDKVNERMLAKLPTRERVFCSSDSVSDVDIDFNFNESLYTTEFLNTIKMSGIPHHKLVLKIGVPVMCMRNIDQRGGLCNAIPIAIIISLESTTPTTHHYQFHSTGWFRESSKWDDVNNRFIVSFTDSGGLGVVNVPKDHKSDVVLEEVVVVENTDLYGNGTCGVFIDRPRNRAVVAIADVFGNRFSAVAAYDLTSWERLFFTQLSVPGSVLFLFS